MPTLEPLPQHTDSANDTAPSTAADAGSPLHRASTPIGVFDSGVGGLSILRAVRHALPDEDLLYVADSANAPYGDRDAGFITQRSAAMVGFLVDSGAKAVVVACNTATVVAIEHLRDRFKLPIVALEPAIKPAALATRSGVVGVLATSRTLASAAVARLCERHARDARILLQPCPGWVEQVERGEIDGAPTRQLLSHLVQPLLDAGADTLVLGCTHYVFLAPLLRQIAGADVRIIESSAAVAQELARRLGDGRAAHDASRPGRVRFHTTGDTAGACRVMSRLWGAPVEVQQVPEGGRVF